MHSCKSGSRRGARNIIHMESICRKKNKKIAIIILISLILALSIAAIPITYAIFTGSANVQRTIGAYNTLNDNFSSNILREATTPPYEHDIYVTNVPSEPNRIVEYVTICNYPQGKQNLFSIEDIGYRLEAVLVKKTNGGFTDDPNEVGVGSCDVIVGVGEEEERLYSEKLNHTFSGQNLAGGSAVSNPYVIRFNLEFFSNENIYLKLTAVPTTDNTLPILSAVIRPVQEAAGAVNDWKGYFRYNTVGSPAVAVYSASEYDGYNYVVEGVGSGTVTITWDSDKVSLSYVSQINLLTVQSSAIAGNSITFHVDSDITGRYELQFYKESISSSAVLQESNGVLILYDGGNVVQFTFVED